MDLSLDFPMLGLLIKRPSVSMGSLPGDGSPPLQKADCLMVGDFHSAPRGGQGLEGRQHSIRRKAWSQSGSCL